MSNFESTNSTITLPILPADPGRVARTRMEELTAAFQSVIESGYFILGAHVAAFEGAFSTWQGCNTTIGVANGTDALELCLRACGIGPNDLVIVPTHTAVATATAVYRAGAEPLLLDIDPCSFNLDLNEVASCLGRPELRRRIRAIVPVHLYGNPLDMTSVMELADRYDLKVIEDCSQAHGAEWQGRKVGNFGAAAAFSCYPTKNLGALGDAGLCITNSLDIAERIRLLRQYGWHERYISDEVGMNSRLDELQAALLQVQLAHLDDDNECRRKIAGFYRSQLSALPIKLPTPVSSANHVYHQFTIRLQEERRDELRDYLLDKNIIASVLYPAPIHLQPAYTAVAAKYPCSRRNAEAVCKSILSLPMHPLLREGEMQAIGEAIRNFRW